VTSTRVRIIGNYIFSPVFYTSLDKGILVTNSVTDTIISGNTSHYMTNGIELGNASVVRTLVHGNTNKNAGTAIVSGAAINTSLVNNW
jgi:hypothetical protein